MRVPSPPVGSVPVPLQPSPRAGLFLATRFGLETPRGPLRYTVRVENPSVAEAKQAPGDSVRYIERTRRLYASQPPYDWVFHDRASEPPPWSPIEGPVARKRLAVVSSGGVHLAEQEPFHFRNDISYREIPIDTEASDLRVAHFGYDTSDAKRDPGCVLPLRALRELSAAGEIGGIVDPALSFMGGIYSARRVREELAPRLRDFILAEQADLALLVPV